MSRHTLEKIMRVYNDDHGDYIEVREDTDGLELIEIQQSENKQRVVMTIEQARLVCKAVEAVAQFVETRAAAEKTHG